MRIEAEDPGTAQSQALLAAYFAELATTFPDGFEPAAWVSAQPEDLSPPHGLFLVVRDDDGAAIGCAGVTLMDAHRAELKRMWLHPSTRGRGLGAVLLEAVEDAARELGATEGLLDTNGTLEVALSLYRRHGWREVPAYNDNPYATHWFAKTL
jgi:GNAT superfamily N-acetyltransferase